MEGWICRSFPGDSAFRSRESLESPCRERRAAQAQGIYPSFAMKNRIKLADPA